MKKIQEMKTGEWAIPITFTFAITMLISGPIVNFIEKIFGVTL
jgi:hypothetical protein